VTFDVVLILAKNTFQGYKKDYKSQQTEGGDVKKLLDQQKVARSQRRETVSI
jgi:hypothetical protein